MAPVYRDYDQAELDTQYSPSSCVPDIGVFLAEYARRSERARAELAWQPLRYGPADAETLDFFPAPVPDAPLLVFVHGGYWRQLGKEDSAFPAPGLVSRGVAFAALNYGLAPRYRLREIVAQARRGLWWLVSHAAELGVAPDRIHISGSSAGAHLCAMALLDGWTPDGRSPADVFAGAILLSGVYDLEPVRLTYVNEPLGLDATEAARNSPIHHLPRGLPPLIVGIGDAETAEFTRQHDEFVAAAGAARDVRARNRNHFDIPFDLDQPDTELGSAVFDQLHRSVSS